MRELDVSSTVDAGAGDSSPTRTQLRDSAADLQLLIVAKDKAAQDSALGPQKKDSLLSTDFASNHRGSDHLCHAHV